MPMLGGTQMCCSLTLAIGGVTKELYRG